jgi:hypothetical protein
VAPGKYQLEDAGASGRAGGWAASGAAKTNARCDGEVIVFPVRLIGAVFSGPARALYFVVA